MPLDALYGTLAQHLTFEIVVWSCPFCTVPQALSEKHLCHIGVSVTRDRWHFFVRALAVWRCCLCSSGVEMQGKKARLQSPSYSPDSQDNEGSHNSRASAHSSLYYSDSASSAGHILQSLEELDCKSFFGKICVLYYTIIHSVAIKACRTERLHGACKRSSLLCLHTPDCAGRGSSPVTCPRLSFR